MFSKFLSIILSIILVIFFIAPQTVLAVAQSTNYKVYGGNIGAPAGLGESTNYSISSGGLTPGGQSESSNYTAQQGAAVSPVSEATDTTLPPGTTAGGGAVPVDEDLPEVVEIDILGISNNQATIIFKTNELTFGYVQYGAGQAFNLYTETEDSYWLDHEFVLKNLMPNTAYNFTIHLRDRSGNIVETLPYSFGTLPVVTSISNVSNLIATARTDSVLLTWKSPAINYLKNIVIVRSNTRFPQSISGGQEVFRGLAESFTDSNVISGRTYYYTVFVADVLGNISSGAIVSIQVPTTEEEIKEPGEELEEEDSASESDRQSRVDEIFEEISDEEAFVEEIPAKAPVIPEDVIPVEDTEKLGKSVIKFFNLLKQGTELSYDQFIDTIRSLPQETKDQIKNIKNDLVDEFGNWQQQVFELLTPEEKAQVEKVVGEPLPLAPKTSVVVKESPVSIPTAEYGADWHVFSGSDVLVNIPAQIFLKEVKTIIATFGSRAYVLLYNADNDSFEAVIPAPGEKGKYQLILQIIYADNTYEEIYSAILVDPNGYVYTEEPNNWSWKEPWQIFTKAKQRLLGAEVTIYTKNRQEEWVIWPAHLYNQINPQVTINDGQFIFVVPPGDYYMTVELEGFKDYQSRPFRVKDKILNKNIKLKRAGFVWPYVLETRISLLIFLLLGVFVGLRRRG